MKNRIVLYLITGLSLLFNNNCSSLLSPETGKDTLFYFNSFENPKDLDGWEGYAFEVVEGDVPPVGGKKALHVAGGCVIPHATYLFEAAPTDRKYILSVWGKWLNGSGGISLETEPNPISSYRPYIGMAIDHPEWSFYETEDTLTVPATIPFRLSIVAGGIISGAILVDRVSIIQIME
jgi:hypothetical protein